MKWSRSARAARGERRKQDRACDPADGVDVQSREASTQKHVTIDERSVSPRIELDISALRASIGNKRQLRIDLPLDAADEPAWLWIAARPSCLQDRAMPDIGHVAALHRTSTLRAHGTDVRHATLLHCDCSASDDSAATLQASPISARAASRATTALRRSPTYRGVPAS